jgi:hypothetical protein
MLLKLRAHQAALPQKAIRNSHSKHGRKENPDNANLHIATDNLLN